MARSRSTVILPAPGTTLLIFPKRNMSYRVVTVASGVNTSAVPGVRALVLQLMDGAGNAILVWSGTTTNASNGGPVTQWSAQNSVAAATGFEVVSIPDDLWVQPQWTLQLQVTNPQIGDIQGGATLQTESFSPAESKSSGQPDDSTT